MKKDILSESMRLGYIYGRIRKVFDKWGYDEIYLPTLEEYNDDLRKGLKLINDDVFYLAKPDITSQIAGNLKGTEVAKLYYLSEVLDGNRGYWQSGVEFIGGEDISMKIEVMKVIIECMESIGIDDFFIDIGSLKVWKNALEGYERFYDQVLESLEKRNFGIIEDLPLDKDVKDRLWRLFNYRGKTSDIEKINNIVEQVNDDRVYIDFGTVRPLPYYDDIIFDIYSPSLGYPLGAGGGYRVNGQMAFGFAFYMENLMEICDFDREDHVEAVK